MNGLEHYRESERLLGGIRSMRDHCISIGASEVTTAAAIDGLIAQAQVHATLALVAATASPSNWPEVAS